MLLVKLRITSTLVSKYRAQIHCFWNMFSNSSSDLKREVALYLNPLVTCSTDRVVERGLEERPSPPIFFWAWLNPPTVPSRLSDWRAEKEVAVLPLLGNNELVKHFHK